MNMFGLKVPKEIYMPIIIIICAIIVEKLLKLLIKKTLNPDKKRKNIDYKKINTIKSLLNNVVKYTVWVFAILSILTVFGVNMAAIITGLGVFSLVIGLAFQDILKDILVGITIVFENQFSIGDLVKIGDFQGTVVSIGLKSTRLRAYTGEVKIISNRNITEIINYSINKTLAVVDIPVSYETKIDKVEKILLVACATLKEKMPAVEGDITLLGVQELSDSAVIFRIIAECKPAEHFAVERQLKKEFKNCLDKNNIKIPYMQIEVHNDK